MGVGKFFGALLVVGGALIAVLCGLCTVVVIGVSVSMPHDQQGYGGGGMVPVALLLGGVPTAFGCLAIWAGIVLLRAKPSSAPPVKPETFE